MTNKTKELVAAGHALAKELHCAESAALVRELATQLDVQLARSNALAAENAGLKVFGDKLYSMYKGLETSGGGFHDEQSIPYQQAALDAAMSAFEEIETPATDAFLAEVRASSIEHAASERWGSGYVFDELNEFAAQLRKGVQS
ncbi:hypothetical protein [Enterobacter kobei]|uniref:hypothetical protein n=1 Tax=Enterobacter kobei TaxID=208224 RepID=UPI003CE8A9E6